jgi:chondroitin AC lyase
LILRLLVSFCLCVSSTCALAQTSPTTATHPATAPIGTLRQRLIQSVLPATAEQVRSLAFLAENYAKQLAEDGAWPDINYEDNTRSTWSARQHLDRLLILTKVYRASRDAGRDNPALTRAINLALNHWLQHDYQNPNWWWNQIGVPQVVGECLILLAPDISADHRARAVQILKRSAWEKWTGQNLVWGIQNQIYRGLISDDPQLITEAYARMHQEVSITSAEGIQSDYSFHQHGTLLYNGSYGLAFANDVGRLAALAWDTPWQIPPEKLQLYTNYMLDAQAWMIWERTFDYSAVGREIVRKGKSAIPRSWAAGPVSPAGAAYSLLNTVELLNQHPLPRADEWQAFRSRLRLETRAIPLFGNKHFWCSDYMVHRRANWFTSVKMLSDRMTSAELVNDEGKRSHHLSDGATFIYRTGDEYRDIFPCWDWRKIPGTTAQQFDLTPDREQIHFKGETSFVGGVSDGTFGLAFMDLKRGSLSGHKAWFFFDNEIVALGAGITSTSDTPVVTTVNQCLLRGPVNQGFNPQRRWVHHNGIGYIFPHRANPADRNPNSAPQNIGVLAQVQTGRWSDIGPGSTDPVSARVFTLGIDHGSRPASATYAYIVLPDTAADQVAKRSEKVDIDIFANTPALQCVYHRDLDTLMAAFFKPGTVGNLTVDQPCLLILRNGMLTLANPENKPLSVHVAIGDLTRKITLPTGPLAGSSITIDTSLP